MAKSNKLAKRKPGRPKTTGTGFLVGVRLHRGHLDIMNAWAASHGKAVSQPEVIRRLILVAARGASWMKAQSRNM